MARNSSPLSKKARKAAAKEVHKAAADLYKLEGIDVRKHLPSVKELVRILTESAKVRNVGEDDKDLWHEFVALKLDPKLYLFLATGSGRKETKKLRQPFLDELQTFLAEVRPQLLVAHRQDRVFRTMLLSAGLLHVMQKIQCIFLDGLAGRVGYDDEEALKQLSRAKESAKEASIIPLKTREGMVEATGARMKKGLVPYAGPVFPPPGTTRMRLRTKNGLLGQTMLVLDSPEFYPKPSKVAYGRPKVKVNGVAVNQVELVMFALANLGKPEWTIAEVGRYLADHGYSTEKLRVISGMKARYEPEQICEDPWRAVRAIVNNLEFYKTGRFLVRLSIPGIADPTITNCFPKGGKWAEPDDFDRIEAYLRTTRGGSPATLGLVGVSVQTPSGLARLRRAPKERTPENVPCYLIHHEDGSTKTAGGFPAIPHDRLAESIAAALIRQADDVWIPIAATEVPAVAQLRARISEATRELKVLKDRAKAMVLGLSEIDDDGIEVFNLRQRQRILQAQEEFENEHVRPKEREVEHLNQQLMKETESLLAEDRAAGENLLLHMVASLRDPSDTAYNELWKRSLTITSLERNAIVLHDHAGTRTSWAGELRITGAGQVFVVNFAGEFVDGAASQLAAKVGVALEGLLSGTPFDKIGVSQPHGVRKALAERLGFESRYFALASCSDPRLVRVAAHLASDPERSAARAAAATDEPEALVSLVLGRLDSGRPNWPALSREVASRWPTSTAA